jgi:hypothetical protein
VLPDLTYADAIAKAKHLIALGQTTVYLYRCGDFPYDKVTAVEAGSSYRLGGPSSCYLIVEEAGLTLKVNVDFEQSDANGRGVSMFDRSRLRELMLKLSPAGRTGFAKLLETECLPGLAKRAAEIRESLLAQADSEDCVRGLIEVAREQVSA